MKFFNVILLTFLTFLSGCNFESGSDDESGGGLFSGHKPVENSFTANVPVANTYVESNNLDIVLTHPYNLTVTGNPRLSIDIGGSTVYATYLTGTGTKNLTFRYTVADGDNDSDGIDITSTIDLNGGSIQYSNSGVLSAATNTIDTLPSTTSILVDTSEPAITLITPPTPKTYYEGEVLEFIILYDEITQVTGNPRLALDIGGSTVYANYVGGTATVSHLYRYQVTSTDQDLDGIEMVSPLTLNGGTTTDLAGNAAGLTFTPTPMPTTYIEGDSPYITSITLPTDKTYVLGETIQIELAFNEDVDVNGGVPSIDLDIGSNTRQATYIGGTGTDTLTFNYIVVQGDEDTNGITIDNVVNLNGATIQDAGTNDANLAMAPPLTPGVLVDGIPPQVTSITPPDDASYVTGQNLDFYLDFNKNVLVTNTPRLAIALDSGTVYANYVTGSGTNTLLFRYNIQAGDIDNDGVSFSANSIDLNTTGTIVDGTYTSVAALLDFTTVVPADMSSILVNYNPPTQLAFVSQPTDSYANYTISPDVTVEFRDASNNLVPTASGNVTLSFGTDPSAGVAALSGTITVAAVGGVATFNDISIDDIQNGYALQADSTGLTAATSNTFNITQSPPTQIIITQEPSDALAGDANSPAITVELRDSLNNLVPTATDNVTVSFSNDASAGTATLGGTLTVAAVAGIATFSDLTVDKAFTGYTLDFSATGLTSATSTSFNINPNVKTQLAYNIEPVDTDYNIAITPAITVEIQDAYGNTTIDTDNITLAINANPGGSTLSGTTTQAAIAGTATFNDISLDQIANGYTLDATAAGLTTATSASFNITATPTQLIITQEPTDTYYNFTMTPAITVEIRDAANNVIPTATNIVTLAFNTDPSAGSATLSGTLNASPVAGVATFSDISIDDIQNGYDFILTSPGLTSATSASFNITQAPATQLAFNVEPTDALAGDNIAPAITVELLDANGNLVSNGTDNVTLAFATDPSAGAATLGGTLTVAAASGVATFNDINIDVANTAYTLDASSGVLTNATSAAFNITPNVGTALAFSVQPTDTNYSQSVAPAIEVQIQDAYGNVTTQTDNITLSLNSNPGGAILSGTATVTAVNGTAIFSNISLNQVADGYTLDAGAGGLTTATSDPFNINSVATQLAITQEPTDAYNDFAISPAITVEIRDSSNNIVTDATNNVTVAINTDPSAGSATLSGTLTVAAVAGIATFSDLSIDSINNGYDLIFTATGLASDTSASFNITEAPATQLAFNVEPTDAVAGVNIAPSVTVEVQDANGNVVASNTDNITLAFGTDASAGAATLGGNLTVAAVAGVATFNDINIDRAFNAYTLAASSGVLTGATSAAFNITPAAASQLAFNVEPTDVEYNSAISPAITVEIHDAFGNLTSDTDTITLSINNNPGGATLGGTVSQAAVAGTATFNDITLDQVGTGYTLDADSGVLTTATSAAFNVIATPTQIIITQEPTDAYNEFNINPAMTVELRDAQNNLVTNATNNVTVAINTDPSAGSATLGGTLTVAAVAGIATFSDINIDVINNGYDLQFTSAGLTSATSASFNITEAPATQLAFNVNPGNTVAGVNIAPAIIVEVQDANGNVVTSNTDNITLAFGTDASAGAATLGGTLTVAAASGVATFNDINIDRAFNAYTLTASSGVLTGATSAAFNITPAAASQLAFNIEPTDVEYNSAISPAITVEIQDAFGNLTADTDTITLSINNNPGGSTLGGTVSQAAVAGTATFNDITLDLVGTGYTLDADSGVLTTATSAAFNVIATPTQIIITQEPTDAYNEFAISPAMTVELRDAQNNLVTNATNNVTVAINTDPSAGSATLGGTLTVAAVAGVATFSDINIDVINNGYDLQFTSAGLTSATSASFNITEAPATQLAFNVNPGNTVAGVNIAPSITVEVQDANGNVVTSNTDNVTLAFGTDASSGAATLGGTLTVAAVAGVATFSDINIDKAFSAYTLAASSGVLTGATSSAFNITPATKSQLAFNVEPVDTEYNNAITPGITIEIQDAFGNVTNDTDTITLAINNNPGSSTLGGTVAQAAVAGTATFNDISLNNSGTGYTLDVTAAGLTGATSAAFNITATPTQIIITQEPTDAYNEYPISPSITAEIRDATNTIVTDATNIVTLSFGTDPSAGTATLGGTINRSPVSGVVTFDDISIDDIQNGYTFSLTSPGLTLATSTSFNITEAPATQLAFNVEPANAVAGVDIAPAITVEVQDANGNVVTSNTDNVTLAFGTDPSGGAATLGGTLTVAAIAGVATFSDINIDRAFNAYTLAASSGGLTGATSASFNITPAAKSQLAFNVEPVNTEYDIAISPGITVEIQDAFGNITTDTDTITLAINNNPGGSTLGGTLSQAAVAGTAMFNDISLDQIGNGYTLDATGTGLTGTTSASFNIIAVPTQLVITQQPTNTESGANITPALLVEVRDSNSNLVTSATNTVTVAINTDPSAGSAVLSGTLSIAAVNGIANFGDLNIDLANTGYDLIFTSPALTDTTSNSFDISASIPTVTIDAPSNILAANETTYSITGTCSEDTQPVTIYIGSINVNPTCTSGTYDTGAVNVSGETDGPSILITADHSDGTYNAIQATANVVKDTSAPSISSNTIPPNTYVTNDYINVTVNFDQTVNVSGSPRIQLNFDSQSSTPLYATYISGTGSSSITFQYAVANGDADPNGIDLSAAIDLNSGTINDVNGNPADLNVVTTYYATVTIDSNVPSITSFVEPVNATYSEGVGILFQVNFNEAVNITGTPRISINLGGVTVYANYNTGTGTSGLEFEYIVQAGDSDLDGISLNSTALELNSGTIRGLDNDDAVLDFALHLDSLAGVIVDTGSGITPPNQVTSLSTAPTTSNTELALSWAIPGDNGTPITSYSVQYREQGESTWLNAPSPTTNSTTVTGLSSGITYEFRVAANNGLLGPYSSVSTAEIFDVMSLDPIAWLDATNVNGDGTSPSNGSLIDTWVDLTGAATNATELTPANQPTIEYNVQNGLPAIRFADKDVGLEGTFTRSNGTDLTFVIVGQFDNGYSDRCLFEFRGPSNSRGFFIDSRYASNNNFNPVITKGSFQMWRIQDDGDNAIITENGSTQLYNGSIQFGTDFTGTGDYVLGDDTTGNNRMFGYISEFLIFDRALTAQEISTLETYLKNKWGTP